MLYIEQEATWKSGVISLLLFQVVTFFGLSLCCTHLSDITLAIACNIMHTFFMFYGEPYSFIFTDKKLNSDTLVRLAYAHYLTAFLLLYIGILHAITMHYDWKTDYNFDGLKVELTWWDEVLANEVISYLYALLAIYIIGSFYLFHEPEPLSYEIFMWGDVGAVIDVRFFGVAPHWYFRPFMAWLTVCPFHKLGVFGLLVFFLAIYNQITLARPSNKGKTILQNQTNILLKNSAFFFNKNYAFWIFFLMLMYTTTFLPAGRYYQIVYGNSGMLIAYLYVLMFLSSNFLRGYNTSLKVFLKKF